jgi:hypothetical protein
MFNFSKTLFRNFGSLKISGSRIAGIGATSTLLLYSAYNLDKPQKKLELFVESFKSPVLCDEEKPKIQPDFSTENIIIKKLDHLVKGYHDPSYGVNVFFMPKGSGKTTAIKKIAEEKSTTNNIPGFIYYDMNELYSESQGMTEFNLEIFASKRIETERYKNIIPRPKVPYVVVLDHMRAPKSQEEKILLEDMLIHFATLSVSYRNFIVLVLADDLEVVEEIMKYSSYKVKEIILDT